MFIEEDLDVPAWIGFLPDRSSPAPPVETFWLITSEDEYVFDYNVNQVEIPH